MALKVQHYYNKNSFIISGIIVNLNYSDKIKQLSQLIYFTIIINN
jgi:hypothetical protein